MAETYVTTTDGELLVKELTLDQAEEIFSPERTDTKAQGREAVVAGLRNAGNADFTIETIGSMPFSVFAKLRERILEMSGLSQEKQGEARAPAEA